MFQSEYNVITTAENTHGCKLAKITNTEKKFGVVEAIGVGGETQIQTEDLDFWPDLWD